MLYSSYVNHVHSVCSKLLRLQLIDLFGLTSVSNQARELHQASDQSKQSSHYILVGRSGPLLSFSHANEATRMQQTENYIDDFGIMSNSVLKSQ